MTTSRRPRRRDRLQTQAPRKRNKPLACPADAACACGRMRRATRTLTQLYDDLMEPTGLRVTQFSLLRTLSRGGPVRICDLAERQLVERSALSRNLEPLAAMGYVDIGTGRDARTRVARITPAGVKAIERATPYWARAQGEVATIVGEERLAALIELLGELEALHPAFAHPPSSATTNHRMPAHASARNRRADALRQDGR